jgi:hypothetical protein
MATLTRVSLPLNPGYATLRDAGDAIRVPERRAGTRALRIGTLRSAVGGPSRAPVSTPRLCARLGVAPGDTRSPWRAAHRAPTKPPDSARNNPKTCPGVANLPGMAVEWVFRQALCSRQAVRGVADFPPHEL